MTQKAIDPKVIGVFVGFLILFFLMLILQCCLGGRTTKKVTKRRARFGASYEDISQRIPASETARPRTFIPASAPVDTILETDIDGIVVIPELDEGARGSKKVTLRRRHYCGYGVSYEDIPQILAARPRLESAPVVMTLETDTDIVVFPKPDKGLCKFWNLLYHKN